MSTRANIKVKDKRDQQLFYRHSDGYPESTLPTLKKFMRWVDKGKIRNNVAQASGWLISIGAGEYDKGFKPDENDDVMSWKVGAYEPATCIHGDIEYLYELNLDRMSIDIFETDFEGNRTKKDTIYNFGTEGKESYTCPHCGEKQTEAIKRQFLKVERKYVLPDSTTEIERQLLKVEWKRVLPDYTAEKVEENGGDNIVIRCPNCEKKLTGELKSKILNL